MTGDLKLRRRQQEITDEPMLLDELYRAIDSLASSHPHSIRRIHDHQRERCNCFANAFELVGSQKFRLIADVDAEAQRNVFFASSEFAPFLIGRGMLLEKNEVEAKSGDIVIYLTEEDIPKHAGTVHSQEKRIMSKWGPGVLVEHALWEVPANYGNLVKYYYRISADEAEREFIEFVRSRDGWEEFACTFDLSDLI